MSEAERNRQVDKETLERVRLAKLRIEDPFAGVKIASGRYIVDNTPEPEWIETGTCLDTLTNCSITKSSLVLLIGGTGAGKSVLATHLACKMSSTRKILYLSFENKVDMDASRMRICEKQYPDCNLNNITYLNVVEEEIKSGFKWQFAYLLKLLEKEEYDAVFIDALQTSIDSIEQDKIHSEGNKMMRILYKIAVQQNIPFFITWQGSRTASVKKEEVTLNDTSGSFGSTRYSTEVIFLMRDKASKGKRILKLLKTRGREGINWEEPYFALEETGKFSVGIIE